jgi:hypothetical protein
VNSLNPAPESVGAVYLSLELSARDVSPGAALLSRPPCPAETAHRTAWARPWIPRRQRPRGSCSPRGPAAPLARVNTPLNTPLVSVHTHLGSRQHAPGFALTRTSRRAGRQRAHRVQRALVEHPTGRGGGKRIAKQRPLRAPSPDQTMSRVVKMSSGWCQSVSRG